SYGVPLMVMETLCLMCTSCHECRTSPESAPRPRKPACSKVYHPQLRVSIGTGRPERRPCADAVFCGPRHISMDQRDPRWRRLRATGPRSAAALIGVMAVLFLLSMGWS